MSFLRDLWLSVPLLMRQLLRNRRRTALTFLGLAISFLLYTSLESVLYTLTRVLDRTFSETGIFLRPRYASSFLRAELPRRYVDSVRAMDGVVAASAVRFYFGKGRSEGSFAAALGVEPEDYLRVRDLPGVADAERRRFMEGRSSALVGRGLLETNSWEVGQRVTIRGPGRLPDLEFEIAGDVDAQDRLGRVAILHIDYLEKVLGESGRAAIIQARVADPRRAPAIARAIDERFANFSVPTETDTEKSHLATVLGSLSEVLGALRAIGYLTLAVTVLVVGNSIAMSVRERTVEIGTLRALGFGRSRVVGMVLGEAVMISLAGGLAGAALAFTLFELDWIKLPSRSGFRLVSDASLVARSGLLAIPLGALAGLQPAWSAVRRPITDALRHAD